MILNSIIPIEFNKFGILPRNVNGIKGILFSPFLHGGVGHLVSNSIPLLILLTTLFYFYNKVAVRVLILSILIGGALVWIFGRSASHHIGASGVVFSLIGFLVASGIFRKNIKALLLSIFVFFMYGGVIWGVLPTQPGVSWEGHLFGFIAGIALAYLFKDGHR